MMKMVSIIGGEHTSHTIEEGKIYSLLDDPITERLPTKSPYELIRFRNPKLDELIIIYQENKRMRSRNSWLEKRALSKLADIRPDLAPIRRNVRYTMNGVETEVDGVSEDTMIEIKGKSVEDETLQFLERKQEKLGFSELILIAREINTSSSQPSTYLYQFKPDTQSLRNYYLNQMTLPLFVEQRIGKRHVRYLKDNGHWTAQNHRYTNTAKWSVLDKFRRDLSKITSYTQPIKIYWSLSAMTGPLDEFRGKGYPINRFLAALDVDGSHSGACEIDTSPICKKCMDNADQKLARVTEKLVDMGTDYRVFSSGSKGYHIYLTEDDNVQIYNQTQMEELVQQLIPDVDTFLSKNSGEFDSHRIFKVPHTVDASTGRMVMEDHRTIKFEDQLTYQDSYR